MPKPTEVGCTVLVLNTKHAENRVLVGMSGTVIRISIEGDDPIPVVDVDFQTSNLPVPEPDWASQRGIAYFDIHCLLRIDDPDMKEDGYTEEDIPCIELYK